MGERIYLLSPAHCGGKRASLLLKPDAQFELAVRLRSHGAPLGEIFAFLSGLYFRGKITYAQAFCTRPIDSGGAWIITPNRGLQSPHAHFFLDDLRGFAVTSISNNDPRYRTPLLQSAQALAQTLGSEDKVILLGSIATDKYVEILYEVFGEKLLFPAEFIGRGDMSRGGLLLRCAHASCNLTYVPLHGAVRRGKRPPRLTPQLTPKRNATSK